MAPFTLLFITIPLVEFYLLMLLSARIGFFPTLALTIVTGIVGSSPEHDLIAGAIHAGIPSFPLVVPTSLPSSPGNRIVSSLDPLLARQAAATEEVATLSELRDTLLPKLISGELRVPELNETAESVA